MKSLPVLLVKGIAFQSLTVNLAMYCCAEANFVLWVEVCHFVCSMFSDLSCQD